MADIFSLFDSIAKPKESALPISWLIVGLGNPEGDYKGTRHNAGFTAIDAIAESLGVTVTRLQHRALTGEATLGGARVLLLKPQTYMNLSGEAVGEAAAFYKIPAERVLVICDDVSFDPGVLRIRKKGSAGGHNGLKSIIAHIGDGFPRIKMGVGKKPEGYDMADFVLGRFGKEDGEKMKEAAKNAAEAAALYVGGKADEAMNRFSK